MITYKKGDILESDAQALINTVNTVGVMGKGIALQFKKAYPHNYKEYKDACKNSTIGVGKLLVVQDANITSGSKFIINFPTKKDWRKPSEYSYIEDGLIDLISVIERYNITSVAIPPLGAGNGGLQWGRVKQMIEEKLNGLNINIVVYEPNTHICEQLKSERVKLTDARALLLYMLHDLVSSGSFVSEFSSEKICYFLQRCGADTYFKLDFKAHFYGPYSGKVRHVLVALNGSYIMGYSDMNKGAFEPLMLIEDGFKTVDDYIKNKPELMAIANRTKVLLTGFYSDFTLELLSSVDYIIGKNNTFDKDSIMSELQNWNDRKRSLFSNIEYIELAINQLKNNLF